MSSEYLGHVRHILRLRSRSQEEKCLYVLFWLLTFEGLDPQTSFLLCGYISIICRSRSSIKVMGQDQGHTSISRHLQLVCFQLKSILVMFFLKHFNTLFDRKATEMALKLVRKLHCKMDIMTAFSKLRVCFTLA